MTHFVTLLSLEMTCYCPAQNPAGRPPLAGCQWLLFQYIRSFPPFLENFSIRSARKRNAVAISKPTLCRTCFCILAPCRCCRRFTEQYWQRQLQYQRWIAIKFKLGYFNGHTWHE
jgi:hypothetical protein